MRAGAFRIVAPIVVMASMLSATASRAAVRVDQDEVIFSFRAPAATGVFLVGDFNQWNPTVEPMERDGDTFSVGLFLVAGSYRYKFVVDGKWILDPDNPGLSPAKGSPIALVERSGGLILSTELPDETAPPSTARFGIRYIGRLTSDDSHTDYLQRIDGNVEATVDHLYARAVVATADSTWSGDPFSIGAFFDRGRVDVNMNKLTFRGFENDSCWASSDPMHVVGDAGVYGYDAGFRRHGASAVAASSHVALRAFLADDVVRRADGPTPAVDIASFAAGSSPDTTVYAPGSSLDGSDVLAFELTATFGRAAVGFTQRDERGINPGMLAQVTRTPGGFATSIEATREDRGVSTLWASDDITSAVTVTAAYGWGGATARAFAGASGVDSVVAPVTPSVATPPSSADHALASTDRVVIAIDIGHTATHAKIGWDYTGFDYDGVAGVSHADVHRVTVSGDMTRTAWSMDASVVYTDARYGDTPDDLHIDWPARNPWLSRWDGFDGVELVGIGETAYSVATLGAKTSGRRIDLDGRARIETRDVTGTLLHAEASASATGVVSGPWYAAADGRWSWYDASVGGGGDFWSGYFEAGYRQRRIEASLGFGFDPVVFDPVINDYADIGWTRTVRGALDDGFSRSRAADIQRSLIQRERSLSDAGVIKVEFIVRLP
jgi:Glycogen recognition site of AMP-activated protein kinase